VHTIAVAHFQSALNVDAVNFIERQRTPISIRRRGATRRPLHVFRQVADVNEFGIGGDRCAGNRIFQMSCQRAKPSFAHSEAFSGAIRV
jgi:hypothetical protein